MRSPLTLAVATALTAAAIASLSGAARGAEIETSLSAPAQELRVPSGPAVDTLHEFSAQTHINLLSNLDLLSDINTNPVAGHLKPADALKAMLAGTGLTFVVVAEHTVVIRKMPPASLTAHADGPPPPRNARENPGKDTHARRAGSAAPQIDEVLIQGSLPFTHEWPGSREIVFTLDDIDAAGGLTLPDFLRSQPEIFGGGPTEDTHIGREAQTNVGLGAGINLRGLDASATLVLINGRRLAPSGSSGAFSDITNIPLSVIERLEITPEGAGIDYGADAAGGVVNLITRNGFRGKEAQAWFGGATDGALHEQRYSLAFGGAPLSRWGSSSAVFALEHYDRDALPASGRREATSNYTQWGGPDLEVEFGNPGNVVIGQTKYPIPAGQDGSKLNGAALLPGSPHLYDQNLGTTALPSQRRDSALASMTFAPGEHFELFIDALESRRFADSALPAVTDLLEVPSTNPYYVNPVVGGTAPVAVEYGFLRDLGPQTVHADVTTLNSAVGANLDFARWHVAAYASYASESDRERNGGELDMAKLADAVNAQTTDAAFNPFSDGSHTNPDVGAHSSFEAQSDFTSLHLSVSGPLIALPAGAAVLTAGAEYRDQSLVTAAEDSAAKLHVREDLGRSVKSVFAQTAVPLIGPGPGAQRLDLSIALRWDEYSDAGRSANPSFGLSWKPADEWVLRGTWAQTLRTPNLTERAESLNQSEIVPLPDATSPTGTRAALLWGGNNAQLRPERAHTWTVGANWKPGFIRDASLALTFFDIDFRDRIQQLALSPDALTNPVFAGRVTLDPTPDERGNVCARSFFTANGPYATCMADGIGAIVDLRSRNAAVLRSRGIDLLTTLERDTQAGKFAFRLQGTYLMRYSLAPAAAAPAVNLLNTPHNPLNLHLLGSVAWTRGALEIAALQSYSNGYRGAGPAGAADAQQSVHPWLTTDLNISYTLHAGWLPAASNSKLFLRIANMFDQYPPALFDQYPLTPTNLETPIAYDRENGDLLGRFITSGIRLQW